MKAVSLILVLVTLIAVVTFCIGLILLFFKKRRPKAKRIALISFVIAIAAPFAGMKVDDIAKRQADEQAVALGFSSAADQSKAERHGFTSSTEWAANRDRIEAEERADYERWRLEKLRKEQQEIAAENARREELEAERQAQLAEEQAAETTRKAKLAAKTISMANDIVERIRSHYGKEPENNVLNGTFCREDGYCDLQVEPFRVQIYGAGIAEVAPSNQAPHIDYIELCGVVFAALTGSEAGFAGQAIGEAFSAASHNGRFKQDVYGIQVNVKPASSGTLGCRFFKY